MCSGTGGPVVQCGNGSALSTSNGRARRWLPVPRTAVTTPSLPPVLATRPPAPLHQCTSVSLPLAAKLPDCPYSSVTLPLCGSFTPPCDPHAEGLRNGLDYETASIDPDNPVMVASPQVGGNR